MGRPLSSVTPRSYLSTVSANGEMVRDVVILVMGVSGAGKTTIGEKLAEALGVRFEDADRLHPPENVRKMAAGFPLTDADRWPWLDAVKAVIDTALREGEDLVVACSALKVSYRQRLRTDRPDVRTVVLTGSEALLRERLKRRQGHFMPPALLASQLATLELPPPGADASNVLVVDVTPPPDALVKQIRSWLGR